MAHRTKLTLKRKAELLERITLNGGNVSAACRACKITRQVIYQLASDDPEFKAKFTEAIDRGIDTMEDEAKRRAFNGTLEPIFYLGKKIASKRVYSDQLMALMLKAHRKKYVERQEHTGPDGAPLSPGMVQFIMPDDGRGGQWAPGQTKPHDSKSRHGKGGG